MPIYSGGGGGGSGLPLAGGTLTGNLTIHSGTQDAPLAIHDAADLHGFDFFGGVGVSDYQLSIWKATGGAALFIEHDSAIAGEVVAEFQNSAGDVFVVGTGGGAAGGRLGFYGHAAAARSTLVSGTATPEQIALALQANGFCGGT